jgi:HlyD family secretion protein
VKVFTDSSKHVYTGTVGFVSPQAEFTPKSVETTDLRTDLVYRIRVTIDHPDEHLRQGMPVTVEVAS